jgi:serine-type D-Ala-D-Ala carboxypeptidase
MGIDFSAAETVISGALDRVFPAAQIEVRRRGEVLWSAATGWLDPETRSRPVRLDTLFDLASVTKLFVVTAFMTLVEEGVVDLDQRVAAVLPEFSGERRIQPYDDPLRPGATVAVTWEGGRPTTVHAGLVTYRHLLTHSSGLPAWRPLYREGGPAAARRAALATYFSYPTGAAVIYSDIGLILIGMAIERLAGQPLDEAVFRRVTQPLGLAHTSYLRIGEWPPGFMGESTGEHDGESSLPQSAIRNPHPALPNIAPTEFCAWRNRRIIGEVHDENAAGLAGVAGHAGLFSTACELAAFGQSFLPSGESFGVSGITQHGLLPTLLRPATIAEMTRIQSQDGSTRRGLGFALWSPDPEASGNPFSRRAFGHTGFTGASLWIDPARDLVVACCTNRVYYGRDAGGSPPAGDILEFRVALHRAIVEAVDA